MLDTLLRETYGLRADSIEKSGAGAGSDTYFVSCRGEKYVLKFPAESEMNTPALEPALCAFLTARGLPVSRFIPCRGGGFLSTDECGRVFHLQEFVEGKMYDRNSAPLWLLDESARMLGKIHTALKDYDSLPTGIGADFFRTMTPERALASYEKSLEIATRKHDADIAADLAYRIEHTARFPVWEFDLPRLTCQSTHGDYFISQLICGERKINAVVDWTTACVHPLIWEIMRSYVYAAPCCARGEIDMSGFLRYLQCYLEYAPLRAYDIEMLAKLFYYQIAVCDYYGQYYASTAANRSIYLRQAQLSTKLLRWFQRNTDEFTDVLLSTFAR